jgi:transcription termination/antitermination protein NusG
MTVQSITLGTSSSSQISSQLYPSAFDKPRWYAVYTWARHEKKIAQHFDDRGITYFLPLYTSLHKWNKKLAKVSVPLFPGYIFVQTLQHTRYIPLSVPGVVHFVGTAKAPTEIPAEEMELLQKAISTGLKVEPYPYLAPGNRVRITSGPMSGITGTIQRTSAGCRIIISVDMIMRSVAVEVDAASLTAA